MKRADVTEKDLTAKRLKELTWEEIAEKIGGASESSSPRPAWAR
jgi:cyanate lyase